MRKSVWIDKLPGGYSVRRHGAAREWFKDYSLAQARKAELKLQLLAQHQNQPDPSLKPLEAMEKYLTSISYTHRESTQKMQRSNLTPFVESLLSMPHLTTEKILNYKADLLKKVNVTTTCIRLKTIRTWCRWLKKNLLIKEDPFVGIEIPAGLEKGRKLETSEIKKIWEKTDKRFRPYLAMLIYTGARKTEIITAEWKEVDLDKGTWFIPKEKCKTNSDRYVPLDPAVLEMLRVMPKESDSLFHGFQKTTARWYLKKACRAAGIEKVPTVHDFRHTFASHWNGHPKALMEMLGWKSMSMLLKYTHLHIENVRQEAATKGISVNLNLP